ncbi:alpha/beta hydrolase, putative, partial [Hepatocystis sp. ex Piliocolobus tephrosceles]
MFFLRHPRDIYDEDILGPIFLNFQDKNYYRRDLIIKNKRGERLRCCFFTPFNYNENTPCIIYTHSTTGSQLEALDLLRILLVCECSVFSYDCAGCGLSDGYYTTSGWNESQDLFLILNHLRNVEKIKTIGLWGKHSGAVCSIIVAALDKNIKLLILDSPYVSLMELYKIRFNMEVTRRSEIFFKDICLYFARKKIKKMFDYDINDICPVFFINDLTIPTIYITSKNDNIVSPAHTLYLAFKQELAPKIILFTEKSKQSYESLTINNKLTIAIKSVLYDAFYGSDINQIFDKCIYTKIFNSLKDKYVYEFYCIDNLIQKKEKQKDQIIQNVMDFICSKYQYRTSHSSSTYMNQSTMDSFLHLNTC